MYPVDLTLLQAAAHMPALASLERSMNRPDLRLHDFCIPVNSYFPTAQLMQDLRDRLARILRYYPSDNQTISGVLGQHLGLDANTIVTANGSTELITWINERLITRDLATDVPTFGRWTDNARELGRRTHTYYRSQAQRFHLDVDDFMRFVRRRKATAIAICNPNNPTGAFLNRSEVLRLLNETRHMDVVVIDESFIDFVAQQDIPSVASDAIERENVIVIKSLGKTLGLHGLRCGYAVTCTKLARELRQMLPPWTVNALAEEVIRAMAATSDDFEAGRRRTIRDSHAFAARLSQINGLTVFPTHANFVYCQVDENVPGMALRDSLLQRSGCFVRECGSKIGSSSQFLRIATRPPEQQRLLVDAMQESIAQIRSGKLAVTSIDGAFQPARRDEIMPPGRYR